MICNGYLHRLLDEESLTMGQWALICARAFGPLTEMRDCDNDVEIPEEFPPTSYHKDRLTETIDELEELERMTDVELYTMEQTLRQESRERYEKELTTAKKQVAICKNMLDQVSAWTDAGQLDSLKKFMSEMLTDALNSKPTSYYEDELARLNAKPSIDVADLRTKRREYLERNVAYHAKEWQDEVESRQRQTEWLKALHSFARQHNAN